MLMMRKRFACCAREREISLDFEEHDRVMTYDGLENCIQNNQSFENESRTSRGDRCASDSLDDDFSSCSSSKDASGSFSSKWLSVKRDEQGSDEWEVSKSPQHFYLNEKKPVYSIELSDVDTMKEKFAKLLLGEDITGGKQGVSTALALSNAITNLAAAIFGELWKLEPLPEERKNKWRREMDWLISPTNYMVELVPAKQNGANGRMLEIMTPKARADIHMNLPALQKLDSMLIETLDSMVKTEFWYAEVGSRAEGRNKSTGESKRWWLPLPQVPTAGLSENARNKLLCKAKVVLQVFKAAKAINESALLEMPVPHIIKEALPKSGKANLRDDLHKVLSEEASTPGEMLTSLKLKSEHAALEVVNQLEAASFVWKERITEQNTGRSPARTSWSFMKDSMMFELDKIEFLLDRAEALVQQIKTSYLNLAQSFLDATKVQYGKDVGHAILEAYSRVLGNLAYSILCRIGEILQVDSLSNQNSAVATGSFPVIGIDSQPLMHEMNKVDGKLRGVGSNSFCDSNMSPNKTEASILNATPSKSRIWCVGKEAFLRMSPRNSP